MSRFVSIVTVNKFVTTLVGGGQYSAITDANYVTLPLVLYWQLYRVLSHVPVKMLICEKTKS